MKIAKFSRLIIITVVAFNFEIAFGEQEKATATQLRDPTRPVGAVIKSSESSKKEASITLNAIFNKGSGSSALVNGRLLRIGDHYAGMRVDEINRDHVVLVKNNEQLVLSMYPSIVKRTKNMSEAH